MGVRLGSSLGNRCVGALVDALARPPLGGQPRADFANGRNRLNREGAANRSEDLCQPGSFTVSKNDLRSLVRG